MSMPKGTPSVIFGSALLLISGKTFCARAAPMKCYDLGLCTDIGLRPGN